MKGLAEISLFLAALCVCITSWSLDIDDPALVGLWLCDEGKGKTISDSSGNENHATGQFEWGKGVFGGCIEIEGRAGEGVSVVVPASESINSIVDALTVAVWFRIDEDPRKAGIRRDGAFLLDQGGNNSCGFAVWTTKDLKGFWGKTPLQLGEWYHVTGTYDGELMKLYINGIEDAKVEWSGRILTPENEALQLKWGKETFVGAMDEIAIFNRALSDKEIRELMEGWKIVPKPAVTMRDNLLTTTWGDIKSLPY